MRDELRRRFNAERHFGSLDGLRCISILAVVWHHCPRPEEMPVIFHRGYLGVDLFFVISGFLITTLLLREADRKGSVSLRSFYMRRILRIFPLYFAFLFALTGYLWLFKDPSEDVSRFFSALPFYATYTSNWIPETLQEPMFGRSWSLAVEEQFYLIWPVLLVSLIFRRALLAILVFLLLSQAVDIGLFGGSLDGVAQKLAPFCAIALGVLVAMALHSRSGFDILARLLGSRFAVLLGLIALCSFLAVPGPVVGWLRVGVHVSMSVLVAAVVLREDHVLRPMLCNHPVVHIGVVSYGVYVLHGQLYGISQWLTERIGELVGFGLGENVFTFFVVFAVVSVAVATVSYRYFESVFLRIKQHYSRV